MGLPFIQPEGDNEWMDNVPWEERGPGRGRTLARLCGPRPGAGVYR
jgi:hypothetical protein